MIILAATSNFPGYFSHAATTTCSKAQQHQKSFGISIKKVKKEQSTVCMFERARRRKTKSSNAKQSLNELMSTVNYCFVGKPQWLRLAALLSCHYAAKIPCHLMKSVKIRHNVRTNISMHWNLVSFIEISTTYRGFKPYSYSMIGLGCLLLWTGW